MKGGHFSELVGPKIFWPVDKVVDEHSRCIGKNIGFIYIGMGGRFSVDNQCIGGHFSAGSESVGD